MHPQYDTYTSIITLGNDICVRLRDPRTKQASYFKVPFHPTTYTPCDPADQTGQWRTLDETPLREKVHTTLNHYHQYLEAAKVAERVVYGDMSPVYQFIAGNVSPGAGLQFETLRTAFLDIEVDSSQGFVPPDDPYQPVTAITVEVWGTYYVWGTGTFVTDDPQICYHKCATEADLLRSFLSWWTQDYPDVITGWSTHLYDMPYLINRINRLHNDGELSMNAKVLSPWRKISHRLAVILGREVSIPDIAGVAILDCMELYRKYTLTQRESYRLDAIAELELGENKISYDEYGSLQKLADENYQKYISYNIRDVELVRKLNNKLHHLDLCVQTAYKSRVNFLDVFKQVRLWDALMYYALYDQQIAVPSKTSHTKGSDFIGAYVKEAIVGQHSWVVSFDVNSLYPSIMRQWNISPDRHVPIEKLQSVLSNLQRRDGDMTTWNPEGQPLSTYEYQEWHDVHLIDPSKSAMLQWALRSTIDYLEQSTMDVVLDDLSAEATPWPWLRVLSLCMSPNKQVFRVDSRGFLPVILAKMYEERDKYKKQATTASKELERVLGELSRRGAKVNTK